MKRSWKSTSSAQQLQEYLLGKVAKHIHRREKVLGSMNRHCVEKVCTIIEKTNEQLAIPQQQNQIRIIYDMPTQKMDNFMSVPEGNVTTVPHINSRSFCSSQSDDKHKLKKTEPKKYLQPQSTRSGESIDMNRGQTLKKDKTNKEKQGLIMLKGIERVVEKEDKYVQVLRLEKEKERKHQENQRKKLEENDRKRGKKDISGARVMFDFECKPTKLQSLKPKQRLNISNLESWIDEEDMIIGNKQKPSLIATIDNVNNITQKEIQIEKKKTARYMRIKSEQPKQKSPSLDVKVNPESHQEVQQALRISREGIKLKIGNSQFLPSESEKLSSRKMSRTEYNELKRKEKITKPLRNYSLSDRPRVASSIEQVKTEPNEQISPDKGNHSQKKKSFVQTDRRNSFRSNSSRIIIINHQKYNEMLKIATPNKTQNIAEKQTTGSHSRKEQLSSVDKYNLRYVKYGGNPPDPEDLVKELNISSKKSAQLRIHPQSTIVRKGGRKTSLRR